MCCPKLVCGYCDLCLCLVGVILLLLGDCVTSKLDVVDFVI